MHPVERRRLGRPDIRPYVLDCVVAEPEQLPIGGEGGLDAGDACRCGRAAGEVLETILRPPDGHAQLSRRKPHQDDVDVYGGLDAEAAARVGRRDQPELRSAKPERGRGNRMQRKRALEVRPCRQRAGGCVPVADDAEGLDRAARPTGKDEAFRDNDVGPCERGVRVAVGERAVGDDEPVLGVHHGWELLVVDLDQLEGVFGEIAIPCDDDGERLACVARRSVRSRVVRDRALDTGRERPGHRLDVCSGDHADHAGEVERGSRVDPRHPRVCELRSQHRRVAGVRDRLDVVHETSLATEQRLVFETGHRPSHPRVVLDLDCHPGSLRGSRCAKRCHLRRRVAVGVSRAASRAVHLDGIVLGQAVIIEAWPGCARSWWSCSKLFERDV